MKIICVKKQRLSLAVCLIALSLAAIISMITVGSYAVDAFAKKRKLPIYCVDRTDKKISISFDCAWGVEYTDAILTELDRHNVKCTFFAVEFWVEKNPDYAKKITQAGHELGTHSKTHPYMSKLSEEKIEEELTSSSKKIEEITGINPTLFRPPFGDYNDKVIETCEKTGFTAVQWDVDSLDWKNLSAKDIASRVCSGVKSGSIILCHNNGLHTAEALPVIFSVLRNRGFRFVPVGELIYKENYTIDHTGKQKLNA